jgi:hypothetical protein
MGSFSLAACRIRSSRSLELGTSAGLAAWCVSELSLLQPVGDPRLAEIVGGHLQANAIADRETDEMLAHFAGQVG